MANPTLAQILNDTKRLIASKQASYATGTEETGKNPPASMPGAEHDSKVPEEAKKSQKEVADGSNAPASGYTGEGGKDDSPKTRGQALNADQAALEPAKKPAVSADADAKAASDITAALANDILSLVRSVQKTAAPKAPESPKAPEAPKVAEAPKAPEAPKQAAVTAPVEAPVVEKGAGELQMELTTDVMAKIAALILSTEEGAALAEKVLEKAAGAQMAQETLAFLAAQSELAEKQAAFEAGEADAQKLIDQQIFEAGKAEAAKQSEAAQFYKLGQAAADASMGDLMGGAPVEGGGNPPDQAPGAGGDDGTAMAPGGEEEVTMEDLAAALESLVAEGTLKPEEAQAIMAEIAGGGAPADGGAGAPDTTAGVASANDVPAPAEAPPAEESKEAGANLLAAIQALKKQPKA